MSGTTCGLKSMVTQLAAAEAKLRIKAHLSLVFVSMVTLWQHNKRQNGVGSMCCASHHSNVCHFFQAN